MSRKLALSTKSFTHAPLSTGVAFASPDTLSAIVDYETVAQPYATFVCAVNEHRGDYLTDSHFVAARLSRGCDTIRCQITPWNSSECGVTCAALVVGTITQASARRAV